jgi:hypothetical protein
MTVRAFSHVDEEAQATVPRASCPPEVNTNLCWFRLSPTNAPHLPENLRPKGAAVDPPHLCHVSRLVNANKTSDPPERRTHPEPIHDREKSHGFGNSPVALSA